MNGTLRSHSEKAFPENARPSVGRLYLWIHHTAKDIDEEFIPQVQHGRKKDPHYSGQWVSTWTNSGIDIDGMTRDEFKLIQPALQYLHDVCKKHNVAVEIGGLDLLPRVAAVGFRELADNNGAALMINIDYDRPYNLAFNPYSVEELAAAQEQKQVRRNVRALRR